MRSHSIHKPETKRRSFSCIFAEPHAPESARPVNRAGFLARVQFRQSRQLFIAVVCVSSCLGGVGGPWTVDRGLAMGIRKPSR